MMWKRCRILLVLLAICGCGKSRMGDVGGDTVTIAYLKSLYERMPVAVGREMYVEGKVVSSDEQGNFYKTLFVEDETGGIALRIDLENYHRAYYRGMELRIACNSLVLSSYGGMLQLGAYVQDDASQSLGYIAADRLHAVISVNDGRDETPVPKEVEIRALSHSDIGRLVILKEVQFANEEIERTWAEPDADTDRYIADRNGNRLAVRTSRYARFAGRTLPGGSGYIEGVLTYFNGNYQFVVCSDIYAVMEGVRF